MKEAQETSVWNSLTWKSDELMAKKKKQTKKNSKNIVDGLDRDIPWIEPIEVDISEKLAEGPSDPLLAHGFFNASYFYAEADSYANKKKYKEAETYYKMAIKIYNYAIADEAENPKLYNNRGCAYYKIKEYDLAIKDFDKALKLAKGYKKSLYNLALAYAACGQYEKSILNFLETNRNDSIQSSNVYVDAVIEKNKPNQIKRTNAAQKREVCTVNPFPFKPNMRFSDAGGMEHIKSIFNTQIIYPLRYKKKARDFNKNFGGGFLLYGPPGCGKSYIAEALAGECRIPLIRVTITDILDMYVGNSEKNLSTIFKEARKNQPCIIFIDEIEALGGGREGMNQHWERTLVNQFLLEMDKIDKDNEQIVVIGATNAPWNIDHALRRSGRFGHSIFVGPPDHNARLEIFKLYTRGIRTAEKLDYEELAELTGGFSCANIKFLCGKVRDIAWKEAVEKNIDKKPNMKDFLHIISKEKSDVKEWFEIATQYTGSSLSKESYRELYEYLKIKRNHQHRESMFG